MPQVFVLTGPSGVGKTTIAKMLLRRLRNLRRVITYTTRTPRPREKDHRDYHFISVSAYEQRLRSGDFFEHAVVYNDFYGISRSDLEKEIQQGHKLLLVLDVQGARSVRQELGKAARIVFLAPDSWSDLETRLQKRKEDPARLKKRLATARLEWKQRAIADLLVVNPAGAPGKAVQAIKAYITTGA